MTPFQIKNDGKPQFKAHNQWATRPADERFLSLTDMLEHFRQIRERSRGVVVSNRKVQLRPQMFDADTGLALYGEAGVGYEPTHWAFGQLCQLSGMGAQTMRLLPPELVSDCVNYGLRFVREVEEIGLLIHRNGADTLRCVTGPNYGRIWNADVVQALVEHVGDGVSGSWRVPGEFGKAVTVNKDNTTLYASDRDCFIFLADEEHRVEIADRRDGKSGSLAKGIYVWNSEVGKSKFGIGLFLFDFSCANRIVWGLQDYNEFTLRHTAGAPDRYFEEIRPALISYANASTKSATEAIAAAQADKLSDVAEFLANRFGPRAAKSIADVHQLEEGREILTRWDAIVGATALARSMEHQDTRVEFERAAGALLVR